MGMKVLRKKIVAVLMAAFLVMVFAGCENPLDNITMTDREYYRENQGTEENNSPFKMITEEESDDEIEVEEIDITECHLRTGIEQKGFADHDGKEEKATIPANQVFEILEENSGYFKVDYNGSKVWLAGMNCLINAKEYIPSLVVDLNLANNPNAYNVGGEAVPGLTDKEFYKDESSKDGSSVWLRYEVAQKLFSAQQTFVKDGYCIRILDAYRPTSVSLDLKAAFNDYMKSEEGKSLKKDYFEGCSEGNFFTDRYNVYDCGVAIDITLDKIGSEKEVVMPTAIYTLDSRALQNKWRDSGSSDSANAQYLSQKMRDLGFSDCNENWWHFQLDSVKRVKFDIPN